MALNELVSRVQGHNDLSSQTVDDFVAFDNDMERCDNTTTNLENQILDKQSKISAESDDEEELPKENETISSMEKCSKFPLTSVRATLKCVEDIKSFLLERDAAHFPTLFCEIEKRLCEMPTNALRQKFIRDFF